MNEKIKKAIAVINNQEELCCEEYFNEQGQCCAIGALVLGLPEKSRRKYKKALLEKNSSTIVTVDSVKTLIPLLQTHYGLSREQLFYIQETNDNPVFTDGKERKRAVINILEILSDK